MDAEDITSKSNSDSEEKTSESSKESTLITQLKQLINLQLDMIEYQQVCDEFRPRGKSLLKNLWKSLL